MRHIQLLLLSSAAALIPRMRRAKHACALFPIVVAVSLSARRPLQRTYLESLYCLLASGDVIVIVAAACWLSAVCCRLPGAYELCCWRVGVQQVGWLAASLAAYCIHNSYGGKDEAVRAANCCCNAHCHYSSFRHSFVFFYFLVAIFTFTAIVI